MEKHIYDPVYVRGLFDRMSNSYERMNFITSFGFSLRWRRQALEELPPSSEIIDVIDLLAGMGETWNAALKRWPGCHLSALDFSSGMLKYARRKNSVACGGRVTIYEQDFLENRLPSKKFHILTCSFGLKTFNDEQLQRMASEVARILKPGGRFTFVEVSKPDNKLLCALYGFYLKRVIPIFGWLFLGNPQEYKMLWTYTMQFQNAKKAENAFSRAGLVTKSHSYFYGCATGFSGFKPMAK